MPHPHSIFLLADHHHHHDGSLEEGEHEHTHGDPESHQDAVARRGPVAQAAAPEGVAGEQISLAVEEFGGATWSDASRPLVWSLPPPLMNIEEPPDPPPPRSLHAIV